MSVPAKAPRTARAARRPLVSEWSDEGDPNRPSAGRFLLAALVTAFLVPVMLLFMEGSTAGVGQGSFQRVQYQEVQYQIEADQERPEEEPEDDLDRMRYVESNPESHSNPPDESVDRFSDRDQQAAQPEPAERDRTSEPEPELGGESEVGPALTDRFFERDSAPSTPPVTRQQGQASRQPVPPSPQQQPREPQQRQREQREVPDTPPPSPPVIAPEFINQEPEELTEEGLASSAAEDNEGKELAERYGESRVIPLTSIESPLYQPNSPSSEPSETQQQEQEPNPLTDPQQRQDEKDPEPGQQPLQAQEPRPAEPGQPAQQPQQPRPRPRVDPGSVSQLVAKTSGGAFRVGPVAYDARWTPFGEYLRQMSEPIKLQWINLAVNTPGTERENGSSVTVKFVLHRDGSVTGVEINRSTAQTRTAAWICQDAIEAPAPYNEWTQEMIDQLGEKQELEFGFHY